MELKLFATVFGTVFIAELGDKTQLATMLFAADSSKSLWVVFLAAALALVVSTALGVTAGAAIARVLPVDALPKVAGAAFVAIGLWMLIRG